MKICIKTKKSGIFLTALLLLSGCSSPEEKINAYLEQDKNFTEALAWLDDALQDNAKDPLLNGLAAEVLIKQCIHTACFEGDHSSLKQMGKHLKYVGTTVSVDDGDHERDVYANILKQATKTIRGENHPAALIMIANAVPENRLKRRLNALIFKTAAKHLTKLEITQASALFNESVTAHQPASMAYQISDLMLAMLADKAKISEALVALSNQSEQTSLPNFVADALPYAMYYQQTEKDPNNGTSGFLSSFNSTLVGYNVPLLNNTVSKPLLAAAIYKMSDNTAFISDALTHMTFAQKQPVVEVVEQAMRISATEVPQIEETVAAATVDNTVNADKLALLKLNIAKASLLVNASNTAAWKPFLASVLPYIQKTGDYGLLFDGIESKQMSGDAVAIYNDTLFKLMAEQMNQEQSILDIFQQVIVPREGGEFVRKRATATLKQAMDRAIDAADYDLIYTYASFEPEIARISIQKVVSFTINALEEKWASNNFEGMGDLAAFLSEKMEIDFSLDSLLIQNFESYLKEIKLAEQLNADTIDTLLKAPENTAEQLGAKLVFMQSHFEKTPEILNNILKQLVVNAEGNYGTPTAFYKLFDLFNDSIFPLKDREEYLSNAIKNSFTKDTSMTLEARIQTASKIVQAHPYVPLSFMAHDVLSRMKTIDDAQVIWQKTNKDFLAAIKSIKPQFSTLMNAVTAYEADDHAKSADLFSLLTDKEYLLLAKPYLQEYLDIIQSYRGTYLANINDEDMHTILISLEPATHDSKNPSDDLLGVKLEFTNIVGSAIIQSAQDLTEDHGRVFKATIHGHANPTTLEVNLSEKDKLEVNIPQSFERIFGEINTLTLSANALTVMVNGQSYTFKKIHEDPAEILFPDGNYVITTPVSEQVSSTATILPIGSIVTLKTNKRKPMQPTKNGRKLSIIYPVSGMVYHPASDAPRPVTGFYSIEKNTTSLNYSYPLGNNASLEAELRCQMLESRIICAGSNKHWSRQQHNYIVSGKKVKVSN